jgi:succinoglycan biosynthesis protein ExoA
MAADYVPRNRLGGLWRQYLDYGEYRARTYRRHPHSMRPSHLLAPGVVATALLAVAAPRWVRRRAQWGIAVYALSLVVAGPRALPAADTPADAALVPVVLLTMHVAHGVGQARGWVRYGAPLSAMASIARLRRGAGGDDAADDPVFAPSLQGPGEPVDEAFAA